MNFEKKIDLILLKLKSIESRIDNINEKFNDLTARFNEVETKFETTNEEIDSKLSDKADLKTVQQLNKKIAELSLLIESYEKTKITQESYDKRLNILIHEVKEDSVSPWEKHETTVTKFQDFLKNGLKIDDPDKIEFVDIYRLPQHPVKKMVGPLLDPSLLNCLR